MAERYIEAPVTASTRFDPMNLVSACMEQDAHGLLVDEGCIPAEFFDLSSGTAGELVQKLTNYRIRLAAVVPHPDRYSEAFQEFAHEVTQSRIIRFFADRDEAIRWLTSKT